ncbi:hypothetical protein Ancab_021011 [Ancistrocladus abbreviatus]
MEMGVEETSDQRQLEEMMTKRKTKSVRKGSGNSSSNQYPPSLARESRDKARARARARTREKILQKELDKRKQLVNPNVNNNNTSTENLEKLGSSDTTPENGDEPAGCEITAATAEVGKCPNHQSLEHQMASVGIIEKLLGTSRSSMYDYEHDDHEVAPVLPSSGVMRPLYDHELLGFPGNWMAENARINSSGYGALMMNIAAAAASPIQDQQNPNSLFMSTSSGNLYLQSQYLHNQFSQ